MPPFVLTFLPPSAKAVSAQGAYMLTKPAINRPYTAMEDLFLARASRVLPYFHPLTLAHFRTLFGGAQRAHKTDALVTDHFEWYHKKTDTDVENILEAAWGWPGGTLGASKPNIKDRKENARQRLLLKDGIGVRRRGGKTREKRLRMASAEQKEGTGQCKKEP